MIKILSPTHLREYSAELKKKKSNNKTMISISSGSCGQARGSIQLFEAFSKAIKGHEDKIELKVTGCHGFCAAEMSVIIYPQQIFYAKLKLDDAQRIVDSILTCEILQDLLFSNKDQKYTQVNEIPFYRYQMQILTGNNPLLDPTQIDDYIALGGYSSLVKALQMKPEEIIKIIKNSGLRGRGGAGFSTGIKWELARKQKGDQKYIICNGDEGDPGAYMDRNLLEGNPQSVLEGMIIGAYAMGATKGWLYVRGEYPLAIKHLFIAINQLREIGILGKNILGSEFDFDLELTMGAGAFVCGEETALIHSIESKRGTPSQRPPFPAEQGLFGKPTNINNVETWANVPKIIDKGAEWFAGIGTKTSKGTKIFSLVGKVKNTGLVEVPMGITLKQIVYDIGNGSSTNKPIKAIQSGGPSGGCIPRNLFDLQVDYDSLTKAGAIMGSGGMIVMDEGTCMVDFARYFEDFLQKESCGKCSTCREGTQRLCEVLTNICKGKGKADSIEILEDLSLVVKDASLCGLGQTAPNPILSTIRYFKNEYLEHIKHKRCRAGTCEDLAISPCENSCFLHINVPGFLELIHEKREAEAFQLFYEQNPMPASTGRVCQEFCNDRCRRLELDGPLNQKEVHRYIADKLYTSGEDQAIINKLIKKNLATTGKKIAIIGAGPAGLSAGFFLARLGYGVVIYDSMDQPGGMLRYAIPEYRLPKKTLDKEINLIQQFGVKIIPKMKIGVNLSLSDLERDFDAILCAIGAWKEINLDIPGNRLKGIYTSLQILLEVIQGDMKNLGENIVIIGGGNAAIDVARSTFRLADIARSTARLGHKVTVVYRRERSDMPAFTEEIEAAEQEGIKFKYLTAPHEVLGKDGKVTGLRVEKMKLGNCDLTGRHQPVATGQYEDIICDMIITAIGEGVDSEIFKAYGLDVNQEGRIQTDHFTLQTKNPKIFAGGDAVIGPSTVTQAMAYGKRAAKEIDLFLRGNSKFDEIFTTFKYNMVVPIAAQGGSRRKPKELGIADRSHNFNEVIQGISEEDFLCEPTRCMRCDVKIADIEDSQDEKK